VNWHLDAAGFAELIGAATRAPSIHNSQPWRFRHGGDDIEVLVDPDRMTRAGDPTGRAARVSCGAAVLNLRLALAVRGTPADVTVCPPGADDVVARLSPGRPRPATPHEHRLFAAIPRRHSNRHPFAETPVPVAVRTDLIRAASDEGGWLDLVLGPAALDDTARLVGIADDILNRDEAYRAELHAWTRSTVDTTDGVPQAAGGPAPRPGELLRRRDFGGDSGGREFEHEPLVGVLGGPGDRPADDMVAGMALQRVLLTATDLGLASSMFSQPIDVPAVREELRVAIGRHDPPQMLLRFGYAVALAPTPRRPAHEVIVKANREPAEPHDASHTGA
jgi:nitroreductase